MAQRQRNQPSERQSDTDPRICAKGYLGGGKNSLARQLTPATCPMRPEAFRLSRSRRRRLSASYSETGRTASFLLWRLLAAARQLGGANDAGRPRSAARLRNSPARSAAQQSDPTTRRREAAPPHGSSWSRSAPWAGVSSLSSRSPPTSTSSLPPPLSSDLPVVCVRYLANYFSRLGAVF